MFPRRLLVGRPVSLLGVTTAVGTPEEVRSALFGPRVLEVASLGGPLRLIAGSWKTCMRPDGSAIGRRRRSCSGLIAEPSGARSAGLEPWTCSPGIPPSLRREALGLQLWVAAPFPLRQSGARSCEARCLGQRKVRRERPQLCKITCLHFW